MLRVDGRIVGRLQLWLMQRFLRRVYAAQLTLVERQARAGRTEDTQSQDSELADGVPVMLAIALMRQPLRFALPL
jgi:hypothetical protein